MNIKCFEKENVYQIVFLDLVHPPCPVLQHEGAVEGVLFDKREGEGVGVIFNKAETNWGKEIPFDSLPESAQTNVKMLKELSSK